MKIPLIFKVRDRPPTWILPNASEPRTPISIPLFCTQLLRVVATFKTYGGICSALRLPPGPSEAPEEVLKVPPSPSEAPGEVLKASPSLSEAPLEVLKMSLNRSEALLKPFLRRI